MDMLYHCQISSRKKFYYIHIELASLLLMKKNISCQQDVTRKKVDSLAIDNQFSISTHRDSSCTQEAAESKEKWMDNGC